jgi:carboxymethylenebutenolidase
MADGDRSASEATHTLSSGGAQVAVEWFEARTTEAAGPAVLMLHGAEGLGYGERYRVGARFLASAGFPVALLHYLDATGEGRVSYATIGRNFGRWAEAVRDGLGWLGQRRGVDPGRLGVVGISLGAALALHVAGGDDRVRAVVDYFGPFPQGLDQARRLPPTLILHGADDFIVPADNARTLSALLKQRGARYERVIYPGQGHGFQGATSDDANRRSVAFLTRHLSAIPPR